MLWNKKILSYDCVNMLKNTINAYGKRIDFFLLIFHKLKILFINKRFLFVGCGNGIEALSLKQKVPSSLIIITDINYKKLIKKVTNKLDFILCEGTYLPFRNGVFNFSYCYHVLEHIKNYQKCIEEISRVLIDDGGLFLATPNRRRPVAYLESAEKRTLYEIITWNLNEWLARLGGNFSPDKYHCGFYEEELLKSLDSFFSQNICLSIEYNLHVSQGTRYEIFIKILNKIGILRQLSPSHTFFCKKSSIDLK